MPTRLFSFWRFFAAWMVLCLLPLSADSSAASPVEEKGTLLARGYGAYSIWQQGFFRIRFMREGKEAVPPADANNNGCPDYVEDVAVQLTAAHHVFCRIAGLRSPLDSPRYAGVRYVDVVIRDKAAIGGRNGVAYDEPVLRPDPKGLPESVPDSDLPRVPVLVIAISRAIDPKMNPTPAHEYFHQIQNGMTHFKNPWFYEGMAAWAQTVAGKEPAPPLSRAASRRALSLLAQDADRRARVFSTSYGASRTVWAPLGNLCPEATVVFPENDSVFTFAYTDGSLVVREGALPGAHIMRRVLERLGELEEQPFFCYNYDEWTEENQRRPENNTFIVDAIVDAAAEVCP